MHGSLDINWNELSRSKIQLVLWHWTQIGVSLVLNKEQINAYQVQIQLETHFKQYNTAALSYWTGIGVALVINKWQINAWQFRNKLKYISNSRIYTLFCDIEQVWGLQWWSTRITSMLGILEINEIFSHTVINSLFLSWTGIEVEFMMNKMIINARQFINKTK